MYICICNAITDRQVAASVAQGATTLADLQADLGVATNCGCCADTAREYLPGGRYCAAASAAVDVAAPRVDHAANDPVPVFQEVVVQRA
ncbi:MAG TPA: (2Fe-2S)-binding protein [Burkholderiaceae bacterium]|nr:(2Fe-2S)-binding protein [Burkholderiaceae bacterium]